MRSRVRLYSFALPAMLLPLLDFSWSQIPAYLSSAEFRYVLTALLSEVAAGIADAAIVTAFQAVFGVTITT